MEGRAVVRIRLSSSFSTASPRLDWGNLGREETSRRKEEILPSMSSLLFELSSDVAGSWLGDGEDDMVRVVDGRSPLADLPRVWKSISLHLTLS